MIILRSIFLRRFLKIHIFRTLRYMIAGCISRLKNGITKMEKGLILLILLYGVIRSKTKTKTKKMKPQKWFGLFRFCFGKNTGKLFFKTKSPNKFYFVFLENKTKNWKLQQCRTFPQFFIFSLLTFISLATFCC